MQGRLLEDISHLREIFAELVCRKRIKFGHSTNAGFGWFEIRDPAYINLTELDGLDLADVAKFAGAPGNG